MLAEVLLDMRGVDMPAVRHFRPYKRCSLKRLIMAHLAKEPQTINELAKLVQNDLPMITNRTAYNRVYQSLQRLKDNGVAVCEGKVWRLAP